MPFQYGLPCMRCGECEWEVLWDDGTMEYALCKKCAKIMDEKKDES